MLIMMVFTLMNVNQSCQAMTLIKLQKINQIFGMLEMNDFDQY